MSVTAQLVGETKKQTIEEKAVIARSFPLKAGQVNDEDIIQSQAGQCLRLGIAPSPKGTPCDDIPVFDVLLLHARICWGITLVPGTGLAVTLDQLNLDRFASFCGGLNFHLYSLARLDLLKSRLQ